MLQHYQLFYLLKILLSADKYEEIKNKEWGANIKRKGGKQVKKWLMLNLFIIKIEDIKLSYWKTANISDNVQKNGHAPHWYNWTHW
jgi:hypothetical protein